jgi:hypothetical protein
LGRFPFSGWLAGEQAARAANEMETEKQRIGVAIVRIHLTASPKLVPCRAAFML